MVVAFFIYWLFSPSGASKLRYWVKTFPQKVASWFWGEAVLPYAEYEVDLPKVEIVEESDMINNDSNIDVSLKEENSTSNSKISSTKSFNKIPRSKYIPSDIINTIPLLASPDLNELIDEEKLSDSISSWEVLSNSTGLTEILSSSGTNETIISHIETPESSVKPPQNSSSSQSTKTSTSLSPQDIRDAEELFGILL